MHRLQIFMKSAATLTVLIVPHYLCGGPSSLITDILAYLTIQGASEIISRNINNNNNVYLSHFGNQMVFKAIVMSNLSKFVYNTYIAEFAESINKNINAVINTAFNSATLIALLDPIFIAEWNNGLTSHQSVYYKTAITAVGISFSFNLQNYDIEFIKTLPSTISANFIIQYVQNILYGFTIEHIQSYNQLLNQNLIISGQLICSMVFGATSKIASVAIIKYATTQNIDDIINIKTINDATSNGINFFMYKASNIAELNHLQIVPDILKIVDNIAHIIFVDISEIIFMGNNIPEAFVLLMNDIWGIFRIETIQIAIDELLLKPVSEFISAYLEHTMTEPTMTSLEPMPISVEESVYYTID